MFRSRGRQQADNPDGLLMDDQLREVIDMSRAACFDWVHTALQDGCMSNETSLFLDQLESKRDMGAQYWQKFLENGWCFPGFQPQKGKALAELFSRGRQTADSKQIKARSSELLSLYALVRHGVEKNVARGPDIEEERDSFLAAQSK